MIGSLISGVLGMSAANKQAKAAERAGELQAQVARENTALQRGVAQQTRADMLPWLQGGSLAFVQLLDELGVSRPVNMKMPTDTASYIDSTAPQKSTAQQTAAPQVIYQQPPVQQSGNQFGGGSPGGYSSYGQPVIPPAPAAPKPKTPVPPAAPPAPIAMTQKRGFRETPGYQFSIREGERGIMNSLSALGLRGSGAALKALTRYRTGVADQEYGNYLSRLMATSGMGQGAAGSVSSGNQNMANSIGQLSASAAANQGNAIMSAADARASGYANLGNQIGGGISNFFRFKGFGGI
jgi:hypothetical protein